MISWSRLLGAWKDPTRDEVVELSLALFAYDPVAKEIKGIIDVYMGQREPSCPVSLEASAKHGLAKRKPRSLGLYDERGGELLTRTKFVVAHNAECGSAFLAARRLEASGLAARDLTATTCFLQWPRS